MFFKSILLRTFGAILLLALVVTSCKRSAIEQTKFIPKDANFVFAVKPKNIQEKIKEGNLNLDSIFKPFSEKQENKESFNITWSDLKTSGVDLSKDLFFFLQTKGSALTGTNYVVGYVAALKSQADFEAFLKKKSLDIQKGKEFSSAKLKDDFMVGWNSDVVIMVVNTENSYARWNDNAAADTVNASLKELDELFSLKKENSIASID
ncbi:MAG: DUF4836 family protein, partial [Chitinophagaceae bacterium]|nr:DUF4836 family protein [Chitinophagaceae bacterium]